MELILWQQISHWAEHVFTKPLLSKTPIKIVKSTAQCFGPFKVLGTHYIPLNSKLLFRQCFDQDQLSLSVFQSSHDNCAYLLIRLIRDDQAWFSLHGAHELCVEGKSNSLVLKRWSQGENRPKEWAVLPYWSWEELVLMYCTFLSLKARSNLTIQFSSDDKMCLPGEKKIFKARIRDNGFIHTLLIYQERTSHTLRLQAAVRDGQLRQCPVWIAFVRRYTSSRRWLKRICPHKVLIADIQLSIFCRQYREHNQRRGLAGAFQIDFINDHAASSFEELFYPSS